MPPGVCRVSGGFGLSNRKVKGAWSAVVSTLVGGEAGGQVTDQAPPPPAPAGSAWSTDTSGRTSSWLVLRNLTPQVLWGCHPVRTSPCREPSSGRAQGDVACPGSFSHAPGRHLCKQNCLQLDPLTSDLACAPLPGVTSHRAAGNCGLCVLCSGGGRSDPKRGLLHLPAHLM